MRSRIGVALAATVLVVASGCAVRAQSHAQIHDDDDVPFGLLDADAAPLLATTVPEGSGSVSLCFVEDDHLIVTETRLSAPIEPRSVVRALSEPARSGTTAGRTAVTAGLLGSVEVRGGVARVDVRPAINELSGDEQLLAVAQVVCTLSGRPGIGQVSFTLEGTPVEVPREDGSLTSSPVSRDDYADLLP